MPSEALLRYLNAKKDKEKIDNAAHVKVGMSLLDYIEFKNPSTARELKKILEECVTVGSSEIIKVYMRGPDMYPVYVGIKVKIRYPNGKTTIFPPNGGLYEIATDISVKDSRIEWRNKFKNRIQNGE